MVRQDGVLIGLVVFIQVVVGNATVKIDAREEGIQCLHVDSPESYFNGNGPLVGADRDDICTGMGFIYTILGVQLCHVTVRSRRKGGDMVSEHFVRD